MSKKSVSDRAKAQALLLHVERYWGLQRALHARRGEAGGAQVLAPTPLKSLESDSGFAPLAGLPLD